VPGRHLREVGEARGEHPRRLARLVDAQAQALLARQGHLLLLAGPRAILPPGQTRAVSLAAAGEGPGRLSQAQHDWALATAGGEPSKLSSAQHERCTGPHWQLGRRAPPMAAAQQGVGPAPPCDGAGAHAGHALAVVLKLRRPRGTARSRRGGPA